MVQRHTKKPIFASSSGSSGISSIFFVFRPLATQCHDAGPGRPVARNSLSLLPQPLIPSAHIHSPLQSSKGKLLELNTSLQQLVGVVKKADLWAGRPAAKGGGRGGGCGLADRTDLPPPVSGVPGCSDPEPSEGTNPEGLSHPGDGSR